MSGEPSVSESLLQVKQRAGTVIAAVLALITLVLHLVFASSYGYFRDELYYLACTEHLDFGYVDHPPLSIAVLWLTRAALGDSLGRIEERLKTIEEQIGAGQEVGST